MKKQKILCVLLVIILLLSISISSFASNTNQEDNTQTSTLEDLNQQRNEEEDKLEEVNSKLEYVQTEMSTTLLRIQELDDKIRQYEQENKDLTSKLQTLEASIKETTDQLNVVTQEHNKRKKLLEDRLVALYEAGSISYLDVLLSAQSLSDFLSIYYAMIEIAEYDNKLIDEVETQRKQIDLSKQKLEKEQEEVKVLKAKAERTEVVLKNTKTLQEGYVKQLSEDEQKINEEIRTYKNNIAIIEAKIAEISLANGDVYIKYTGGEMIWPIAISGTAITSDYGTREHPIQGVTKFHQGIDIGNAYYGSPVVAVADGVVTYSGWLGSYGNCIMVYHGDGITSLYAHGQRTLVEAGTQVKQGDVIMEVGSTGNSTGPHLHFEIRLNGVTVNPLIYVNAPK